jgi:thiamine biosynthesis protein ThiS
MDTETISVVINGESREVPANQCLAALLDWLSIASDRVAVELNKSIVRKRDWAAAQVANGARIEIVEFVGGG